MLLIMTIVALVLIAGFALLIASAMLSSHISSMESDVFSDELLANYYDQDS